MRQYITDNGYEMMLPDTDERVMTSEELEAKYAAKKPAKKADQPCPKCHTYCGGECDAI
jgi:hypothetical protein